MCGLWFVCGCEGVGLLWGFFLVCEGVRVFVCVLVFVCFSGCVSFVCPLCGLCGFLFFLCVLRFRFLWCFLVRFLVF